MRNAHGYYALSLTFRPPLRFLKKEQRGPRPRLSVLLDMAGIAVRAGVPNGAFADNGFDLLLKSL